MSNIIDSFINKKKAESVFLTLEDGESIKGILLRDLKMVSKIGFGGEEKEVLRLMVDVDTSEGVRTKQFDNPTARFAKELQDKNVVVGGTFTLTRTGLQAKTRYTITDVTPATE